MRRQYRTGTLALWLCVSVITGASGAANAQNNFDLDILAPGEILLNLSASEQREVEQDTLHASLYYAARGRDRAELQDEVNRVMAEVLQLLEDSDLEYSTQQYYVHQVQTGRPTRAETENPLWRAQQGVQLTSGDSAALLDMAAELQGRGLTMSGLNYSLSPERREQVSDALLEAALQKLGDRARAAADTLGKSRAELIEVSINGSDNNVYRPMSTMAMRSEAAMDVATPVAEPGITTVTLSVSARAILSP